MRRKLFLLSFVALLCSACVKERTCICEVTDGSSNIPFVVTIGGGMQCSHIKSLGNEEIDAGQAVSHMQTVECREARHK